jgi:U3 small nucleolar RNA-associated protein 14
VRNLKKAAGRASAQDLAAEDERVEIDLDAATLGQPTKGKGKDKGGVQTKKREGGGGDVNDGEPDEDEDEDELMPASGVKAFSQRDLVAEAFAGDNVVEVSEVQIIIFIMSHPIGSHRVASRGPILSGRPSRRSPAPLTHP